MLYNCKIFCVFEFFCTMPTKYETLCFDTETTGFVEREGPLEVQPYIVQFSGILLECDQIKTHWNRSYRCLCKTTDFNPICASQVHWIYDKDVADKWAIVEQMDSFLQYLNRADIVIGHNIEYDESVINYELQRLGRKRRLSSTKDPLYDEVDCWFLCYPWSWHRFQISKTQWNL